MKRVMMLTLVLVFVLSVVLTGCGGKPVMDPTQAPTAEPEETKAPEESKAPEATKPPEEMEYKESPYLAGKGLPPVKERLPKEPKLTNEMPPDQLDYKIGEYGGTFRSVRTGTNWDPEVFIMCNEPLVNTPGYTGEEITPNILKDFEMSSDAKEFTFYMREGLKWSDGEPVTVEDVRFAVEDVLFDPELMPSGLPAWLKSEGKTDGTPLKFEVIDDYTFKISFDKAYGGFPLQLAVEGWRGYTDLLKPAHFLKKFHKKYTPLEELEPLIAEAKFQPGEWVNLFNLKDVTNWEVTNPEAIGFPMLTPWVQVKSGDIQEYERNPYYFKIDAAGNQLPYIDRITSTFVQDLEMVQMKILSGEIDHSYEYAIMSKVPLYKENEEKGNFRTMVKTMLHRTAVDLYINLTYDDDNFRKVVRDVRFRQALNLAVDKDELVDTVYYGYAKPAELMGSRDVDMANKLLDEMGMTKGPDGFRKGPDGKTFEMTIEYGPHMSDFVPTAEIIVENFREVGLNINSKQISTELQGTRMAANELEASLFWCSGPVMWEWADWGADKWGQLWWRWYTSHGREGEEPPAEVLEFYQMVDSIRTVPLEEAKKVDQKIRESMKKNVWFLFMTQDNVQPVCINKKLMNFDDGGFAIAQSFAGEQWWFQK